MANNRPTVPKNANLLDLIIYKGEKWLYEEERALDDAKVKSQIFNNMASVRVKQSTVALNNARLKRVELQNQFLEIVIANAQKNGNNSLGLPTPNTAYCSSCQTHHPPHKLYCCGLPTVPEFLDQIQIGANYGK